MAKPVLICDTEVYKDYFLCAFRNVSTGNVRNFEMYEGQPLYADTIRKILKTCTIVTFNGIHFDMPVLFTALTTLDNAKTKAACDMIIVGQCKWWHVERKYGFTIPPLDHIDTIEIAPGKSSLKAYGGKLHTQTIVDLPIDPASSISPAQREELKTYCAFDLKVTQELYKYFLPQIELREKMSDAYGIDLRSKSDAQIAEHVIKSEIEKLTKNKIEKPQIKPHSFRYKKPEFISFSTPLLNNVLNVILDANFYVIENGKVILPDVISELDIQIGSSKYVMGIGGLHSTESSVTYDGTDAYLIRDFDVASYYPSIILQAGMYPIAMGKQFLTVYKNITKERLAAKAAGDKVKADSLKITVNGGFGKFGNQYSTLYSPDLLIQTTITGQLALLMLIEMLEVERLPVISANTDGIVVYHSVSDSQKVDNIIASWELLTGFDIEETSYKNIYLRDINNYIAIKDKGYKVKGAYAPAIPIGSSWPNPHNQICTDAVVKFLSDGTDIARTISECRDIRKFVTIRQVKGGAVKDGVYLGRVVRWYYSRLAFGAIHYKVNNYTVPKTEGAEPCMTLPNELPCDINYDYYTDEAYKMLNEVGYVGAGSRVVSEETSKSIRRPRKKA